jgi:hypothetical protein
LLILHETGPPCTRPPPPPGPTSRSNIKRQVNGHATLALGSLRILLCIEQSRRDRSAAAAGGAAVSKVPAWWRHQPQSDATRRTAQYHQLAGPSLGNMGAISR